MGIKISEIKNQALRELAQNIDNSSSGKAKGNGIIDDTELSLFIENSKKTNLQTECAEVLGLIAPKESKAPVNTPSVENNSNTDNKKNVFMIHKGMKLTDAYKQDKVELFNKIDLDINGVLDQRDINTFTKPTLKFNAPLIHPNDEKGHIKYPTYFYVGMKYEDVQVPHSYYRHRAITTCYHQPGYNLEDMRRFYANIDTNRDGVLSEDEILNCDMEMFPKQGLIFKELKFVKKYPEGLRKPPEENK